MLNHFPYFSSSPAAVSIKNPAYININNAMNARIPSTRLIAVCITSVISTSLSALVAAGSTHGRSTHPTPITHHRCARLNHHIIAQTIVSIAIFIVFISSWFVTKRLWCYKIQQEEDDTYDKPCKSDKCQSNTSLFQYLKSSSVFFFITCSSNHLESSVQ